MKRIAMWSGPRNLSTAMMYAFGNRADCWAVDEPFYAAYLAKTGLEHPMRAQVLQSQSTEAAYVVKLLAQPKALIHYEKHMTHHMCDRFPLEWMANVTNVFLIRHPARVIASYEAKRENPVLADLGFVQQKALADRVAVPLVVDADDILTAPRETLNKLCAALGIPFDEAMLTWPAGPKPFDGVWADHWYGSVHSSTGFGAAPGPLPTPTEKQRPLLEQALPIFETFKALAL